VWGALITVFMLALSIGYLAGGRFSQHKPSLRRLGLLLAVAALTAVPARAIGLGDRLGLLEPGYAADIVVLDDMHNVTSVWAAGARLH
jgi:N-acetylglucosamine-6-phosphate deacetylase